jgi:hypothetical protein
MTALPAPQDYQLVDAIRLGVVVPTLQAPLELLPPWDEVAQ